LLVTLNVYFRGMKLNIILSLFFVFSSFEVVTETEQVNSNDSIQFYYEKSRNEKVGANIRIRYINSAIDLASINRIDSLYLKCISYKSKIYASGLKNYDSALVQAFFLRDEAEKKNNKKYIAKAYDKLGRYSDSKKEFLNAYKYYEKSLENYKELNDSLNIIKVSKRLANTQNALGAFIDAENTVVEALSYGKTLEDKSELSWLYDVLAIVKRNQKLYNDAISAHREAIEYENSEKSIVTLKNNYAVTLIDDKKYLEAIEELEPLLEYKDLGIYSKVLDNFAHAKSKLQYTDAEELLIEALHLREINNDLKGQYASHIHFADHYEINKKRDKSLFHIEKAYQIAQQIKSPDAIVEALGFLVPYKEELFSRYKYLRDSLVDADIRNKNQFAKIRYDFQEEEKKKNQALRLKAESDLKVSKTEKQNLLLLFGILILILVSIVVYYLQKQKAKQKLKLGKLQERYQTETRLSKKIHDEVGNDIFYLMTQIEKDPSLLEEKGLKLLDGLQTIYSKARDISREYTAIDTGEGFPEEIIALLNSFGNQEVKIITRQLDAGFWDTIDTNIKSEVFRIVQELLTNMKKHSQASHVAITFKKDTQNLTIQYADNGVGIKEVKPTLRSVENRIDELKGVLTFDLQSDEGLNVSIILPI